MLELIDLSAVLALLFPNRKYRMLWHRLGRFIRQEQREKQVPSEFKKLVINTFLSHSPILRRMWSLTGNGSIVGSATFATRILAKSGTNQDHHGRTLHTWHFRSDRMKNQFYAMWLDG